MTRTAYKGLITSSDVDTITKYLEEKMYDGIKEYVRSSRIMKRGNYER